MKMLFAFALATSMLAASAAAQTLALDTEQSSITVRVYKAGLFSVFGHDHEIHAPISRGEIKMSPSPGVDFSVQTAKMVVADPGADPKERSEVQATMLGPQVLDVERYPEIHFHSVHARRSSQDTWLVDGELTIHGQTRPVQVTAKQSGDGQFQGAVRLNQKDYGIQPISLAGGTIKVKPEIQVEFKVVTRPAAEGPQARL